jgi:hypothetical protein
MDFKGLQQKAKRLIERRGGSDSVKGDAKELKDIVKSPGSLADKAKRAGDALKDPGARATDAPSEPPPPATAARDSPVQAGDVPAAPGPDGPPRR